MFLIDELLPAPDPGECCSRFLDLPYLLFLDGQGGPPDLARYSYLSADPWMVVRGQTRETVRLDCRRNRQDIVLEDPLDVLEEALRPWRFPQYPGLPPFQGGAAGWISTGALAVVFTSCDSPSADSASYLFDNAIKASRNTLSSGGMA